MRAHSFDVFDTLVTRRVGSPTAVIDLLAARLEASGGLPVPAAVFAAGRKGAEGAMNRSHRRHATLVEIYDHLAASLNETSDRAREWLEAEEDLERELCLALPGAAGLVREARADSDRIVFVSDTPHREALVRELLEREGLCLAGDTVYVSSGRPHSKQLGGIFGAVSADLGTGWTFLHTGDNPRADVASPRLEGWASQAVPAGRLNRYEALLEQRSTATANITSWLAGASRLARLEARERGVAAPLAEVAAGVVAPMLVGYALWVVGQARRHGVTRLYFVLRDGEAMQQAAAPLVAALAPEIELRLLHGSRRPWILGATTTSPALLEHWVTPPHDVTPRAALARVGLTPEDAYAATPDPVLDPAGADQPMGAEARARFPQLLLAEPLRSRVAAAAEEAADLTTAYLRQEGLLDGIPDGKRCALVDAGWKGNTSVALDHLVRRAGGTPPVHYMLGALASDHDWRAEEGLDLVPWLFDRQRRPDDVEVLVAPNTLVEMFCAGTQGRCLDYEMTAQGVRPVLAAPTNQPVLDWGLLEVREVVARVAELVAPHLEPSTVHTDLRGSVTDVLTVFWNHPSAAEATVWGAFPWEDETWPPYSPVAQRVTTADVVSRLRRGDGRIRPQNSWRAGSAAVSGEPWRTLLRARAAQTRSAARIARVPRRVRLEIALRRRSR